MTLEEENIARGAMVSIFGAREWQESDLKAEKLSFQKLS